MPPRPVPARRPLLAAALVLLGAQVLACASGIQAMYDEEKLEALAKADAPSSWQPDLRLRLSQDSLDGLVQTAMDAGLLSWKERVELKLPLGVEARLDPQAEVERLTLSASQACEGCLAVDARLDGKARWSAAGASGTVPFTARVGGTVSFAVARDGQGWALSGRLRDVDSVKVGSAEVGTIDATSVLGDWVRQALSKVEPIALGTVGGAEMPLAAARLVTSSGDLEVQLLSDLADRTPIPPGGSFDAPWELRASTATLLGLARREAFEQGAIAYETAAIPTALRLDGDAFTLGLRLWRLEGSGWWRDYEVQGDLSVKAGRLSLSPTSAEEGDKSKGAGLADPLALLAEGRILQAVADGVKQTIPVSTAVSVGDRSVKARLETVTGAGDVAVLTGSLHESAGRTGMPQ